MPGLAIGVSRRDITPPVGLDLTGYVAREGPSVGVLDPLGVTALVLHDEGRSIRVALVSMDILGLTGQSVAELRRRIEVETGIPGPHVMFAASHTHAGPATQPLRYCGKVDAHYLAHFHDAVVAAVSQAAAQAIPVRVAAGHRESPRLTSGIVNRRVPGGPVDPRLTTIVFRRVYDDAPISVLFRFTCHPVALGAGNRQFSGDWVAFARRLIEARDPNVLSLFANGPAGNINPARRGLEAGREWGTTVGEEVLAAVETLPPGEADARLAITSIPVELPMLAVPEAGELHRASERYQARAEEVRKNAEEGASPEAATEYKRMCAFADWASEALPAAGTVPAPVPAEVHVLRIGEIVLVGFPGETFVEYGLQLVREFGPHVVPLAYVNQNPGYIPWPDAYAHGGYEVDEAYKYYGYPACFAPNAGERLLDAARQGIRTLLPV